MRTLLWVAGDTHRELLRLTRVRPLSQDEWIFWMILLWTWGFVTLLVVLTSDTFVVGSV